MKGTTKTDINNFTESWLNRTIRNNSSINENQATEVREYAKYLIDKKDGFKNLIHDTKNNHLLNWYSNEVLYYFPDDIDQCFNDYGAYLNQILKPENSANHLNSALNKAIYMIFQKANHDNIVKYIDYLLRKGFDEFDLIKVLFHRLADFYDTNFYEGKIEKKLSNFGYFISSSRRINDYCNYFCSKIFNDYNYSYRKLSLLEFIYENNFTFLNNSIIQNFLLDQLYNNINELNINCAIYLLEKDVIRWEKTVILIIEKEGEYLPKFFKIYTTFENQGKIEYRLKIDKIIREYFQDTFFKNEHEDKSFTKWDSYSIDFAKYLSERDEDAAFLYLSDIVKKSDYLHTRLLDFIENKWEGKSIPILVDALFKQPSLVGRSYFIDVLTKISKYGYSTFCDILIEFAVQQTNKSIIAHAAKLIAFQGTDIENKAVALLNGKIVSQRILGALILTNIETETAKESLLQQINSEKNDDTRDIIIETLQDRLYGAKFNKSDALEIIDHASKRNKLNKFPISLFLENELPKLYWTDGSVLGQQEIRFLFYRIARSKGLNSDIEARSLISVIDTDKSGNFAKFMLKAFADSGYNSKYKFLLTLSAMLGGNESVSSLNTLFRKAMTDKKMRLAELAIEAMAVIGTNKALRSIEVISRKLANKKPKISNLALESLNAAASELGITQDQLSDRIIPDFDFDGNYKTFKVNEEEYRAFINKDFTLSYMDEDNKIRKSLPKDIDKVTKASFNEIQKEIKDVIKNQEFRLSYFFSSGRKWVFEEWVNAFLNHPIMTIYAQKFIWYFADKDGHIKEIFLVQEDTSLTDIDDNEIYPEEEYFVGLLHPIMINDSTNYKWRQKLYEINMKTLFPQLEKVVFKPSDEELGMSESRLFADRIVPKGPDFVKSWLEKRGWYKETGDGGYLNFSKSFQMFDIKVNPMIEGVGVWFQQNEGKAIIYEVYFTKISTNEKLLIKEIPPIIFSETMNDINGMLEVQ